MLIVLEGIDGSGKSSIGKEIAKHLNATHLEYPNKERMPQIKEYLNGKLEMPGEVLISLFLADILWDQERINSKIVVASRYVQSTAAYSAPGVSMERAIEIIDCFKPTIADVVFLLDVDIEEGVKRKKGQEIYDKKKEFLSIVRNRYFKLKEMKFYAKEWVIVDANRAKEEVLKTVIRKLNVMGVKG